MQCPGSIDNICSGKGECTAKGTCVCDCGWTGDDCNTREETCNCFGGDNDVCLIGTDCDTPCGAVLGSDADLSCSGRPFVTGENLRRVDGSACVCLPGWWGADCTSACPGIDADTGAGAACGGHGTCDVTTGR